MSINQTIMKPTVGAISGGVLMASVVVANWATSTYGFVDVGFGQQATAGTFAAGFALAARDAIQDAVGKKWMLVALAVAAAISYIVADPFIATASFVAFVVSELLDFFVYTPIRRRSKLGDARWAWAVGLSSVVGIVADTVVFLWIAFGFVAVAPALVGQLVGKGWATVAYLVLGKAVAVVVFRKSDEQPVNA